MEETTRERLERKYRPELFEDCRECGEASVCVRTHVCDPIRKKTYDASFASPSLPNEAMVSRLEEKLLEVLVKHRIVVTSEQLRDLALAVEPSTHGPCAA